MSSDANGPQADRGRDAAGAGAGPRAGYGRDVLGLVLLVASFFVGVAVVMAYVDPKDQASGLTGMVMALVDTLGVSAMFLAAGLGWIGYRLWIRGVDGKLGRDLFGVLLTTCTLAVLVGSLAPEFGGDVGALGAVVSKQLTVFVGLPFGLMVVLLPAWFLWLRPAALASGELARTSPPIARRASDSSGVSLAEAEGLLPKAPARPTPPQAAPPAAPPPAKREAAPARSEATLEGAALITPKVVAPSPYPPDVRREGRVPEGARPLGGGAPPSASEPSHPEAPRANVDRAASASAPSAPPDRAAPHDRERDPRDDAAVQALASAGREPGARELERGVQPHVADAAERGLDADVQHAGERASVAADDHDAAAQVAGREAVASGLGAAVPLERTPPPPSWEQPDLFEEPVDAYGTPLSLVESLRRVTPPASEPSEDSAQVVEPPAPATERSVASSELATPWGDEPLDDEVFEETVRPLETAATLEARVDAPQGDDEPAAARFEVRFTPALEREAPTAAEVDADTELERAVSEQPQSAPEAPAQPAEMAAALPDELDPHAGVDGAHGADENEAVRSELRAEMRELIESREPDVVSDVQPEVEPAAEPEIDPQGFESTPERTASIGDDPAPAPTAPAPKPAVVIRSLFEDEPAPAPTESAAPSAAEPIAPATTEANSAETAPPKRARRKSKSASEAASAEPVVELTPVGADAASRRAPSDAAAHETAPEAALEDPSEPVVELDGTLSSALEPEMAPEIEPMSEVEPEVELVPARPRPRSRLTVDEVVYKAGCLFVERQRVAVSMLQREFGLDFDAATRVLDQLQRAGLIGPYLGGQRRDILLSLEEWNELVGVE